MLTHHSDILAELDLPASGISDSQGPMGFPTGIHLHEDLSAPWNEILLHYSSQIHLCKVLNHVHTNLYKARGQVLFAYFVCFSLILIISRHSADTVVISCAVCSE